DREASKTIGTRPCHSPPAESVCLLCGVGEPEDFGLGHAPSGFREEIGVDEAVQIAVEDALGVADLVLGAVVLDELVRVQDVAADRVAAEAHVHVAALLGELGVPLLLGLLGEAWA